MADEFAKRTSQYVRLDQRLACQTRFFAAAALINGALAQLCALRLPFAQVPVSTLSFLTAAGCVLEATNLRWARCIGRAVTGTDFDWSLVIMEQLRLERILRLAREQDACRYAELVRQVDRMLGWPARGTLLSRNASLRALADVLPGVAREIGRPPSFSLWGDRVRIGHSLIRYVRVEYPAPADLAARFMLHPGTC
jgi:hypothetical protein